MTTKAIDFSSVKELDCDGKVLDESFISTDTVSLSFMVDSEEPVGYVRFDGFETVEDAREYIESLSETLPLLLFNSVRVH